MPSEKSIVNAILKYLRDNEVWCFKHHGGPYATAGVPDIIGCYKGEFIAIEVKQPGKDPTGLQEYTLNLIRKAGGRSLVAHSVLDVQRFLQGLPTSRVPY